MTFLKSKTGFAYKFQPSSERGEVTCIYFSSKNLWVMVELSLVKRGCKHIWVFFIEEVSN